jgi:hypothetical protein
LTFSCLNLFKSDEEGKRNEGEMTIAVAAALWAALDLQEGSNPALRTAKRLQEKASGYGANFE